MMKLGFVIGGVVLLAVLLIGRDFVYKRSVAKSIDYTAEQLMAACTRSVIDYAYMRDAGNADGNAALFTDDGVLVVNGAQTVGRDQIASRVRDQVRAKLTRHMMTNIRITPTGKATATGSAYAYVAEAAIPAPDAKGPAPASVFFVLEYKDAFVMTENGCRFTRREVRPVIMSAAGH